MAEDKSVNKSAKTPPQAPISKEEQIGYHKGALSTLIAERNELLRIVNVTESLMQAHMQELEKLGVKISKANSE